MEGYCAQALEPQLHRSSRLKTPARRRCSSFTMSIWFSSHIGNIVEARGPPRSACLSMSSVGNGCEDGKGVSHSPLRNGVKYVMRWFPAMTLLASLSVTSIKPPAHDLNLFCSDDYSLLGLGFKKHPIGKPLIGSFSPRCHRCMEGGPGVPSFRAPHRLQSADALGRAGGDSDGRGVDPRPGAAAPAAARVPARRSGPPCALPARQSNCGCHCQIPGVDYRAARDQSDPGPRTLPAHGSLRA